LIIELVNVMKAVLLILIVWSGEWNG